MDLFDLVATIRVNMDNFDRGLDEARRRANDFASSVESATSGLKDITSPAVDGFKAVESVGGKAMDAVKKGLTGFAAASTAVAGFGAAAVKSGMNFDATMSEVSAISGATGNDFDDLRNKALEMGAKTKFSASEAAEAMTYMGMAGWKTKDMIGGIEGIMNLAAASGEDLATTSDIVTNALTAFGLQASDSAHFADIMATAASSANTDVHMMGESFKYAAPVMGTLGYSAEDTAVALGLMGNAGIQASMAGTSLKTAMLNMASPTKAMAGVMSQYGISLTDTSGEMYSLGEVMAQLRDKMGGLDETTKAAVASTLFGKEAASGMLAIVNAAPEDFDKLTASIDNCNGSAERMSKTMMDNLAGDIQYSKSTLESLQIAISDSLTPTLREFAQFGQKAMASLLEGFQGGGVSGLMSALSSVVTDAVTFLAGKAPEFADVSMKFIEYFSFGILNAKDAIIEAGYQIIDILVNGISTILENDGGKIKKFGVEIIDMLASGFLDAGEAISVYIGEFIPTIAEAFLKYHEVLFTVGIEILGAIGEGIVENKEELQSIASETIANMVTALSENAPAIIEGGIALIEALAGAIMENMPLILETGAEIVGQLVAGITSSLPALALAIVPILTHIGKIIDTVGKIKDVVKTVVEFVAGSSGIGKVIEIGKKLMAGIQTLFGLIAAHPVIAIVTAIIAAIVLLWNNCEAFRDFVKGMVEAIIGFFSNLYEGISSALSGLAEFIGGVFSTAWDLVKSAWGAAVEFFSAIWDGIQAVFSVVADILGGFFSAAWEAVQAAWEVAEGFFSDVWEAIKKIFSVVEEVLGGYFKLAWAAIKAAWSAAVVFFGEIWDGIKDAANEAAEKISEFLTKAWDSIKEAWEKAKAFFKDLWDSIKGAAEKAATAIGGALKKAWENVKSAWNNATEFFRGIVEKIVGVFSNIGSRFLTIGKNIVEGIKNGISNAWNSFIGWLGGKVSGIVDAVKGMLGIHSPSKVFAGIGENMALGLAQGWDNEYSGIKREIENGLSFSPASVGMNTSGSYSGGFDAGMGNAGAFGGGNFTVNIYNPERRDAVTEAREWKKTSQQIAMGLV